MKLTTIKSGKRRGWSVWSFDSFEAAEKFEREWHASQTPAARLRTLEMLRQQYFGYGQGKPLPRFQRTLQILELGTESQNPIPTKRRKK